MHGNIFVASKHTGLVFEGEQRTWVNMTDLDYLDVNK